MDIRIEINWNSISNRIGEGLIAAQVVLDEQVLKDSNSFAPQDTGNLIESGIRSSAFGSGRVEWDTPYARKLYYNPQYNFSKDRNPQAGGLWFERAKAARKLTWGQMLMDTFRENF